MSRYHISSFGVGVSSHHLLPLLLLLLLLLLLGSADGEEEVDYDVPSSLPTLPLCGDGETEERCLVLAEEPLSWQEAHNYCRSVGGFLASRDQYTNLSHVPYSYNTTTLTWTALTPLHGHYQWLSKCPASTDFSAWREGRVPRAWDRACAGLDLTTMKFELTKCSNRFPVFCFLEPSNLASVGEGAGDDVYLVVEGDPAPGPEGNLTLRREDFGNLSLTCTAYNKTSGRPLSPQPSVFWRKDLVYSGHCIGSLIPATLHDRTKSRAAEDAAHQDAFTTQQGTYWCEAWGPTASSTHLTSNKVLLTLEDIVVYILEVQRKENSTENLSENEAKTQLRRTLFNDLQRFPLDLVSASKEQIPGPPPNVLASYTFHLHVPKSNTNNAGSLRTLEKSLEYKASKMTERFIIVYKYENTSRVTFPDLCLSHKSQMEGAPVLKWPATFIGPVHPVNTRCEIPHGRLAIVGRCLWNYTHGARLEFNRQSCQWRDLCPKGYTAMRDYCLAIQPPGPWRESFNAIHTTSREMSLLDEAVVRSRKVWRQVKRLVESVAGTDYVWLPDKRLRTGAPLQHLGPIPRSGYNLTKHNINWAQDHPLPNLECLALNLTTRTLHTHSCHAHLPFPALIQAPFLNKRVPLKPPLWKESMLCEGWQSPVLKSANEVCFKLYKDVGDMTWTQAQRFCNERQADLPSPNIGFLDYVFRQELRRHKVDGVWMYPHWIPERVVYRGPQDVLNWAANTNYSLPYGELTPTIWLLRDGGTHQNVLCQRLLNTIERLRLNTLPPVTPPTTSTTPATRDICIQADPMEMLALTNEKPDLRCFVNGRKANIVPNTLPGALECVGNIEPREPGYYQCVAWTVAPVTLTFSNTILQSPNAFTILVTLLEPELQYDPLLHDATFMSSHTLPHSCSCCEALNVTLANIQVPGVAEMRVRRQHFSSARDGRLVHSLHVECRGIVPSLSQFDVLESLSLQLSLGQEVGGCTVHGVRSTQGCERDITMSIAEKESRGYSGNLTWPSTYGPRQVVPEEPCVTSNGEPVTRECIGDFLLGYQWGPAGHCTGTVSKLTRELWLANREPHNSLQLTETALMANISALQPVDIFLVAKTLEAAAEAPPANLRLAQLVSVLESVLAADTEVFQPVQQRLGSSDTLLEAFENLFLKINATDGDTEPQRVSGTCLSVEGLELTPDSPVIGYKSMEQPVRGRREETLVVGVSKADLKDAAAAIILPANISLQVTAREVKKRHSPDNHSLPLFFAVYRNDKLFQESEEVRTVEGSGRQYRVNSEVIQATFGTEVRGLREPVKIYFKPRLPGNDTKCVFWDLHAHGHRGGWSEEGCYSGGREGDHHVCLCYHLTCFAELINYDKSAGFSGTHAAVLNTITVIGCCLSLLGLLLVFFTFLLFQRWRRPLSNKILVNLCLAEFCSLTVFLAGIDQTVSGGLCRGVAVALHYFILTSFAWMLVEAVHQYLNFVKVVGTYIPRFMWKASVCAWGVPLLPIIALLVYDSSLYDHDGSRDDGTKICWMSSSGFWIAMLPPLAATMGVNLVMYGLILYGVTCGRPSVPSTLPERALLMNQLRMAVCVFFLLGLTWVFGLLAVSSARVVFSYLFCTFTTFKGFLLFVFHVCRERGARRYWEDFLSVLKHESSVSSPGDSAHAPHSGRSGRLEASFNPCGGIMVLPPVVSRHPRTSTRTSLLSARSSSTTAGGSRTSFFP